MAVTENKKLYKLFDAMTGEQYEHCTLGEKLSVYVQHYPAVVVPFLKELIEEVDRLEEELVEAHDKAECLADEIDEGARPMLLDKDGNRSIFDDVDL